MAHPEFFVTVRSTQNVGRNVDFQVFCRCVAPKHALALIEIVAVLRT